ncbi:nuclear transport factor 2 family protein [Nocardia suismassiliense]|uniref:nuclear transport factor 2 family protein n=1 Tax=Nocardia suismassiliense TaxID=2077092 RepID=UPI000D1DCF7B|nr:nuclear transport factor 2 family protein [Nocardia suismassiliense]
MPPSSLDLIAQVYRAFDTRDFGVIPRLFAPDIDINQADELPWGGHHHGHAGAVRFFTTLLAHIDSTVISEQLFAAGDAVVQVGRTTGMTIPDGIAFDLPEVHVWHVRDGLIAGYDAYIDTPAMLTALAVRR